MSETKDLIGHPLRWGNYEHILIVRIPSMLGKSLMVHILSMLPYPKESGNYTKYEIYYFYK